MKLLYNTFFSTISLVIFATNCNADATREFYTAQAIERFARLPQNARTLGMAGASIQTTSDSSSILGNPAGLGRMTEFEVSASGGQRSFESEEFISDDTFKLFENSFQLYAAIPLGDKTELGSKFGTLSLGFSRFSGSSNDSIKTSPDGHLRTLAYSISPLNNLSIGYSLSFVEDQLHSNIFDYHSHSRFMHLLGAQLLASEKLTLGSTFGWLVGQTDSEEFSVMSNGLTKNRQYRFSFGGDYKIEKGSISAAVDYDYYKSRGNLQTSSPLVVIGNSEEGETLGLRLGTEHRVISWLTFRGGYRYTKILEYDFKATGLEQLSSKFDYSAFSGGLGFHIPKNFQFGNADWLRIDYGLEYRNISKSEILQMLTASSMF